MQLIKQAIVTATHTLTQPSLFFLLEVLPHHAHAAVGLDEEYRRPAIEFPLLTLCHMLHFLTDDPQPPEHVGRE